MCMLQKIIEKDVIMDYLVKRTSLTKPQLDTLLISSVNIGLGLNNMILLRDKGKVTKGSFIRTLKQANNNIEKSLYTIIILEYLSILEDNNIQNLVKVSRLLKDISNNKTSLDDLIIALGQISHVITNIMKK